MTDRDPLVENKAFAFPQAVRLRNRLEVSQHAAMQVMDVGDAFRLQKGGGLLAADAAGAVHGDLDRTASIHQRPALVAPPVGKVAKAARVRLHRAPEGAHRAFVVVARVDHEGVRVRDQGVPVLGRDIGPRVLCGIKVRLSHGDDLGLDLDLEPMKRRLVRPGELHFKIVKARQGADQRDQARDGFRRTRNRAVQALACDQQRASNTPLVARLKQARAQGLAVFNPGEAIKGGDADRAAWRDRLRRHAERYRGRSRPSPLREATPRKRRARRGTPGLDQFGDGGCPRTEDDPSMKTLG